MSGASLWFEAFAPGKPALAASAPRAITSPLRKMGRVFIRFLLLVGRSKPHADRCMGYTALAGRRMQRCRCEVSKGTHPFDTKGKARRSGPFVNRRSDALPASAAAATAAA